MELRWRRAQSGLTIIEIMIVTAIVAVIAAIALPAIRGYTLRAKVSEAVLAGSNCRTVITEIYLSGNELPGLDNWGCEVEKPTRFIERIRTTNEGKIIVTMGNEVNDLRLALHDITMVPMSQYNTPMGEDDLGSPIRKWRCGNLADLTDIKLEYLPASCRGGG